MTSQLLDHLIIGIDRSLRSITRTTLLAPARPLRGIRLVSFGAEEQLSVGSAAYVAAHRREMASIGALFNLDSVTSPLGHHWLLRAGSDAFGRTIVRTLERAGLDVVEKTAPMPFADQFPFSVFGVPAVTFLRPNMDSGMRWQHHSAQDNLDNVSVTELARVIAALTAVVTSLSRSPRWPFGPGLAPSQVFETARLGRELFGERAALVALQNRLKAELRTTALAPLRLGRLPLTRRGSGRLSFCP